MREQKIVVVGGGLVGLMTSALLLKQGFSVHLIERRTLSSELPQAWQSRVSAINRTSWELFTYLGLAGQLLKRAQPYQKMRVWAESFDQAVQFDATELAEPQLGFIIENQVMISALIHFIEPFLKSKQLTLTESAVPEALTQAESGWRLELQALPPVEANLLVAADGGRSWIREQAGITVREQSYHQQAVVANLQLVDSHQATAWQRFLPEGPVAMLPLADPNVVSLVWSAPVDQAQALVDGPSDALVVALNDVFAQSGLPAVECVITPAAAFPLAWRHAETYIKPGLALVGDAAHSIHPLAGQGVNLGFADAQALVTCLTRATQKERPFGSMFSLKQYQQQRRAANTVTMHSMTALLKLYGQQEGLLSQARNLGERCFNRSRLLKLCAGEFAMGPKQFSLRTLTA